MKRMRIMSTLGRNYKQEYVGGSRPVPKELNSLLEVASDLQEDYDWYEEKR